MLEVSYGFLLARRTLVLAGVLVASCCALFAQADPQSTPPAGAPPPGEWRHHGPGIDRELHHLTMLLSLTAEQQTQVKALLTAQREQFEELHKQSSSSAETATPPSREQVEAIHQATDSKIEALLNEEQKTKFAAWQKEREQRMMHGPGGAPPPDAPGL
jgi:periplasmic protein CpxP/Spy